MEEFLSEDLRQIRETARSVAVNHVAAQAEETDSAARWPAHTFKAMAEAGLLGLQVPTRFGGKGQGMLALAVVSETLGQYCSSSALCFGMHCVGSAVIAAKATPFQEETYLRPIASGQHVTTLALSEHGSGAHFYFPSTCLRRENDFYQVDGAKQFVTNGGHADSYVLSASMGGDGAHGGGVSSGEFSCVILDRDVPGATWADPWDGFGMRGNSSRGVKLSSVKVPTSNLLGREGDQVWYVFEVIAPYFLTAMAGTYLGIAQAAFDIALQHLRNRQYSHSGETLSEAPVLQHRIAELWMEVQKTRGLLYEACRRGDLGDPDALPFVLSAKADSADTAVNVVNEAMTICGGAAYSENSKLTRLLRDARASHVMAPTTDLLKQWTGRALLGMPLL